MACIVITPTPGLNVAAAQARYVGGGDFPLQHTTPTRGIAVEIGLSSFK